MSTLNKIKVEDTLYDLEDTEARKELLNKIDKVEGKELSTNDFTNEDKSKLDGLSNYDDTELRNEVNNKADKSEIPSIDGLATEEYVDNAIENINIPSGGEGGGNVTYFKTEMTLEEATKTITINLPVSVRKFFLWNLVVSTTDATVEGTRSLNVSMGGDTVGFTDTPAYGTVNLTGIKHGGDYVAIGKSQRNDTNIKRTTPTFGDTPITLGNDSTTISLYAAKETPVFSVGTILRFWGVYYK